RAGTSPPTVGPHAQAVENERRAGTSIASWRQLAWQSVRDETTHAAKSGLSTDTCPVVRFRSDAGSKSASPRRARPQPAVRRPYVLVHPAIRGPEPPPGQPPA